VAQKSAKSATGVALNATRNDLNTATRGSMVHLLNQQLADTSDLFSQVKQAHWNVKGPNFIALHELFDDLAGGLIGCIDDIAERAVQLGGSATGTVRMAAATSRLPDFSADAISGIDAVVALADRFAALAASTRAGIDTAAEAGDADTADLLTEVSRSLDKSLWFLEAHLHA
jgi:starvation-inducible DNA-binding protein